MSFQRTLLHITVDEELDKQGSLSIEHIDCYLQTAAARLVKLAGLLIRGQSTNVCLLPDLPPSFHQDPQPPRLPPACRSVPFVMPTHKLWFVLPPLPASSMRNKPAERKALRLPSLPDSFLDDGTHSLGQALAIHLHLLPH